LPYGEPNEISKYDVSVEPGLFLSHDPCFSGRHQGGVSSDPLPGSGNHLEHGLSWVFLQRTASHFGHAVSKPEPALSFEHIFTSKPEQPLATLLEDLISGSFKGTAGGKPDH